MSPYIDMDPELTIKKSKVEEFKTKIKEFNELLEAEKEELQFYYDFIDDNISVDDDGTIQFEEYNSIFYGFEEFVAFIAPYMERDSYIHFTGEDGEKWGYHFCGNGGVKEIVWIKKVLEPYFIKPTLGD